MQYCYLINSKKKFANWISAVYIYQYFIVHMNCFKKAVLKQKIKYYYTWPSLNKFKTLMSSKSITLLRNLGIYLKRAMQLRPDL